MENTTKNVNTELRIIFMLAKLLIFQVRALQERGFVSQMLPAIFFVSFFDTFAKKVLFIPETSKRFVRK